MRSRRFLVSLWAWRALLYVATSIAVVVVGGVPLVMAFAPLISLLDSGRPGSLPRFMLALLASLVLAAAWLVLIAAPVTRLDIARAQLVDDRALPRPSEPRDLAERWRRRFTDRAAWLQVFYVLITYTLGAAGHLVVLVVAILAVVLLLTPLLVSQRETLSFGGWQVATMPQAWLAAALAPLLLAATPYLSGVIATAQVALGRLLLADPIARFQAQLTELTRSRERLVHSFDAERQRIERDLHDGAQQSLVALTMRLGLARMDLERRLGEDDPSTLEVVEAHEQAKQLIGQLREFIRGIHPKVLSDIGLGAALDQLAAGLPLPVAVRNKLRQRPSPDVESTLYFSLAEALTNVVRHSAATHVDVTLQQADEAVTAEVVDDGCGGADPRAGTGLSGIADRVAVLDGTVWVSSPPGGPTLIRIRIPDREKRAA